MDLADSLGLMCLLLVLPVSAHYSNTNSYANSVIDLIFLGMSASQVLHCIEPDFKLPLDHTPLLVNLPISLENICFSKKVLKHNSDEEGTFLSLVSIELYTFNFSDLGSIASLNLLSKAVSRVLTNAWEAGARSITVTTQFKEWWNDKYKSTLEFYRCTGAREDWYLFHSAIRNAK